MISQRPIPLVLGALIPLTFAAAAEARPISADSTCESLERLDHIAHLESRAERVPIFCEPNPRPVYSGEQVYIDHRDGFTIHYTTDPSEAAHVSVEVVEYAAAVIRLALAQSEQRGFNPLPDDSLDAEIYCDEGFGGNGGSGYYDFYFVDQSSVYGYAQPTSLLPGSSQTAASFVALSTWIFNGTGAAEATVAHELFHAIQWTYDVYEANFWMEQSAVWMEDEVFPEANDYLNYVPMAFQAPYAPLDDETFIKFGYGIWPMFFSDVAGDATVRGVWERCADTSGDNALTAQEQVLDEAYEGGWRQALLDFRGAMYTRDDLRDSELMTTPLTPFDSTRTYPYEALGEIHHTGGHFLIFQPPADPEVSLMTVNYWFGDINTIAQVYVTDQDGNRRAVPWTYIGDVLTSVEIDGVGDDITEVALVITHASSANEMGSYSVQVTVEPSEPAPPCARMVSSRDGKGGLAAGLGSGALSALILLGGMALRRRRR